MSIANPSDNNEFPDPIAPHRLELEEVELIDANRRVRFRPGLNIIQGNITTGKTTFVRLLRALLGTMPDDLPPEVEYVSSINGRVVLGTHRWILARPRNTNRNALVEVIDDMPLPGREPEVLRLPVSGRGETYSSFLLNELAIPNVSVPTARARPTESLSPVTMTDWLGYCIIPGDELDTQVFGHEHPFRDGKRKWVFELAYGYYDPEVARLASELRGIELRLEALDKEAAVRERFLIETPFADPEALTQQLVRRREELEFTRLKRMGISSDVHHIRGVPEVRESLMKARSERADLADQITLLNAQIKDLSDLTRQLSSQSDRLTRAVVAGEWLVDFDFVVCPRCGNDVNPGRGGPHLCYLCQQEPQPSTSRDQMLAEQSRINSQITETKSLIDARKVALSQAMAAGRGLDQRIAQLSRELDALTATFISDRASLLEQLAADEARIEADIGRLNDYADLLRRHQSLQGARGELERQRDEVALAIEQRELGRVNSEPNIRALEARMLEYLEELHVPELGHRLFVAINRRTFLPTVSGRSFDKLSSQGLKTLVNVAHSLAHHTVAIDRGLPMPGLLVLDGLSANVGSEGFDQERVNDMYRLLVRTASEYSGKLQIVAVDNELPRPMFLELADYVVLTLTQSNRLIRPTAG